VGFFLCDKYLILRDNKMAKIIEETIVIKVSKLTKEQNTEVSITPSDFTDNIEAIVQQLVGEAVVVEIFKAD
jgi:tRNA/tmRNA/rRNA uracil-C5-methylase (TrmA/RlmC/RlmD family)